MLTPQDVSSRVFPKAMMGGYNMASVDEFLDVLTDDYTTLYKENAALKAKMKVLVDKVEEYRATEDAMRAALLAAQKMANSIVEDAEKKKAEMLEQAETQARAKIGSLQAELQVQQSRLAVGQKELSDFVQSSRELCQKQLAFLESLPTLPVEEPAAPAEEETDSVAEIEESILAAFAANPFVSAPVEEKPVEAEPVSEPTPVEDPVEEKAESEDFDDPFFTKTRVIKLDELKFGRNYNGEE